jgi:hypothetical protein
MRNLYWKPAILLSAGVFLLVAAFLPDREGVIVLSNPWPVTLIERRDRWDIAVLAGLGSLVIAWAVGVVASRRHSMTPKPTRGSSGLAAARSASESRVH